MKVAMTLTLDSLLRALRAQAYQIADDIETGYRRDDSVIDRGLGIAKRRSNDGLGSD